MVGSFLGSILRTAWPKPSIDRILRAALLEDQKAAAVAWREFEAAADFDRLTAGELQIIGLVSKRLKTLAPDSPMRGRIGGVERAQWSRNQLVVGEAGSGLRALEAEGVGVLVIKGAGLLAAGGASARGRVVGEIDLVVRPDVMEKAFDVLTGHGWRPVGSGTLIYHRTRLSETNGIKLVRGQFGNLGLHRTAYSPPHASTVDDASIWERSGSGTLAYASVRLPSATDTLAVGLAQGVPRAGKSGDWLADIAAGIDRGVDWELVEFVADRLGLQATGAVGLRYVRERLERPVPCSVLLRLEKAAIRRPLAIIAALTRAQPKGGVTRVFGLGRAVATQRRLLGSPRRTVFPSPVRRRPETGSGVKALDQVLLLPDRAQGKSWTGTIDLILSVDLPPASRCLDFEVNSSIRHHVRLRALVRDKGTRERLLRFRFPVTLSRDDTSLVLTAAPSRSLDAGAPQHLTNRYGATPFRLVHLRTLRSSRS